MGAILKRLWTTLFGSAVGLFIAGAMLSNSYSIWFFISAGVCLVIAMYFLIKDIKIAGVEDAKRKIEQDNRLSQIETVRLICPDENEDDK